MVSRILISIALLCSSVAFSQEETALKFNQVLLVELTEEGVVVPEGKVWKVMSAVSQLPYTGEIVYFNVNNNQCQILRGSTIVNSGSSFGNAATSGFNSSNVFPMWLPSGTNLSPGNMVSALSIIEFNTD